MRLQSVLIILLPMLFPGALKAGEAIPGPYVFEFAKQAEPTYRISFKDAGQDFSFERFMGRECLLFRFNCKEAPNGDIHLDKKAMPPLPEGAKLRLSLVAYVKTDKVRDVCLRIVDAENEMFQFRKNFPVAEKSGWKEIVFEAESGKPPSQASSWDANKEFGRESIPGAEAVNKRIDMPLKFYGVAIDYRTNEGVGDIALERLVVEVVK